MKLDLELIESILLEIEEKYDGITRLAEEPPHNANDEDLRLWLKRAYHYNILCENGFIDGHVNYLEGRDSCQPYIIMIKKGLTLEGHQLLDSMRNDTLWNKLKVGLGTIGVETLKQIPALAISLLTKG